MRLIHLEQSTEPPQLFNYHNMNNTLTQIHIHMHKHTWQNLHMHTSFHLSMWSPLNRYYIWSPHHLGCYVQPHCNS